eukprot:3023284-Amphidinium_carterae.1
MTSSASPVIVTPALSALLMVAWPKTFSCVHLATHPSGVLRYQPGSEISVLKILSRLSATLVSVDTACVSVDPECADWLST